MGFFLPFFFFFPSVVTCVILYDVGYNLQCDLQQLSHSYGDLECFKYYEMLLDIQKLFKQQKGGLSGLAKVHACILTMFLVIFIFFLELLFVQ